MQPYKSSKEEVSNEMDLQGEQDTDILDNLFDAEAQEVNAGREKREDIVQRFVFFDFEKTQEKVVKETAIGQHFEHIPNVCVARVICDDC